VGLFDVASGEGELFEAHRGKVGVVQFSNDGKLLMSAGEDFVARLWDLETAKELFALRLPTQRTHGVPLWDFDFRCTEAGDCWIAVPLTMGRLALYRLPYRDPPASIASTTPGP